MEFYNTLTKKKEVFKPLAENKVKIYVCGPTVYNFIHLGNARPMCVFDVLRRYLIYREFKVTFVQNFTDIDDKIIAKANENGVTCEKIADLYKKEYKKDAHGLNVDDADIHPTATGDIFNMVEFVSKLMDKGYAYKTDSGDVYFRTGKFARYGNLSGQSPENLQAGARVAIDDEQKEDPCDFVLWKSSKPGEPWWPSPWGNGRPGWHLECSTMIKHHLGIMIDIHCGGQDLTFPHHENEIAQSECCNGRKLANYWLHNGFVNINHEKMSKSLNNFFTVREIAEKFGYEPIRYLMISAHYRTPINYSEEVMSNCKSALSRLYNCKEKLDLAVDFASKIKSPANKNSAKESLAKENLLKHRAAFIKVMDDDLNTAGALAVLFDLVRDVNSEILSEFKYSKEILVFSKELLKEFSGVLGILSSDKKSRTLSKKAEILVKQREEARKNKDFRKSDELRNKLLEMGVILQDTSDGVVLKFSDD
ncbi:MAG: cysteine--tRNA ligase [Oscillospiraceae bacterium]|jgi:cysteinyl-tRNA synthetase|nr:cysteine--tRNA ligase [Oscillospiraceae bacterium]